MGREYIQLYFSFLEEYSGLTDEQFGQLVRAGLIYGSTNIEPEMTGWMALVFPTLKRKIDKSNEHYNLVCEKRSASASKRWDNANACKSMQMDANGCKAMQNMPREKREERRDIEKDTTNVVSKKKFTKPGIDDCISYFVERGSTKEEAQRFYDYYESNGWKVGKNSMKDYKAAIRNWLHNNFRKPNTPVDYARQLGKVVDRQEHSGNDILAPRRRPLRLHQE